MLKARDKRTDRVRQLHETLTRLFQYSDLVLVQRSRHGAELGDD